MIQNVTLRVLIAVAVGVFVWWTLLQVLHFIGGAGNTNIEYAVMAVLTVGAAVAIFLGLGKATSVRH